MSALKVLSMPIIALSIHLWLEKFSGEMGPQISHFYVSFWINVQWYAAKFYKNGGIMLYAPFPTACSFPFSICPKHSSNSSQLGSKRR